MTTGAQFIESGAHQKVLVVGADVMSSILNPEDRATLVLFGDGAGAVLLEPSEDGETGIFDFTHEIDGSGGQYLCMPGGGGLNPSSHETVERRCTAFTKQDNRSLNLRYVQMEELSRAMLDRHNISGQDIDVFIAHQANIRIIEAATEKLGLDPEKVIKNIHKYGNTTAATVPLAIGDALDSGKLKKNDLVLFAAVEPASRPASSLARWAY
ncbi:MAG: 3-oxoacyl-[acyl-carrier-protein] synthase III C-terminal domain-containing protein [Pyrinomonadaceae bacterium]